MLAQTLTLGLLLLPGYQWLDAAGSVDYINNHSQDFIRNATTNQTLIAKAPIMKWNYISSDLNPVQASSGPIQTPSCTYKDCPELDYLVVPGPDPNAPLPDGCAEYLQSLMAKENFKGLLTVCTGSLAVAKSGILDGLHVCSNKIALKQLAEAGTLDHNVNWIGDRRWHVDGKVWSSGGITAGIDLAAEFARVHFDPDVVELAKEASEYVPRPAYPDPFAFILKGVSLD